MAVAIAGISGRFPKCSNLEEFYDKLLAHEDLVTDDDDRWSRNSYQMPRRMGKIPGIDRFDADFFNVPPNQADSYEPRLRHLLELTFEAIIDAGFSPNELRGKNIGVYVGASGSDFLSNLIQTRFDLGGAQACNHANSMLANRISYAFDFHGPSMVIDTACSSSFTCLQQAHDGLRLGDQPFAIVAGISLLAEPKVTRGLYNLGVLSPDGKCQAFSARANGYVRSEAAVVALLSPVNRARRIYAEILHVHSNTDGYNEEGVTHPSASSQEELYRVTCSRAGVKPGVVHYIEMHGTGTAVNEVFETAAVDAVFCKEECRTGPLLVGSVKSNMGHSEAAAGLCGLAKVIVSYCGGVIPGNLHYDGNSPHLPPVAEGRVKVVSENTVWPMEDDAIIVGVNSMGFGGAKSFALLSFHQRLSSTVEAIPRDIPTLIPLCGRSSDAVNKQFGKISARTGAVDQAVMAALLQAVACGGGVRGHDRRAVVLTEANGTSSMISARTNGVVATSNNNPKVLLALGGVMDHYSETGSHFLLDIKSFKDSVKASYEICLRKKESAPASEGNAAYFERSSLIISTVCNQIAMADLLAGIGVCVHACASYSVGKISSQYVMKEMTREEALELAVAAAKFVALKAPAVGGGDSMTIQTMDNILDTYLDTTLSSAMGRMGESENVRGQDEKCLGRRPDPDQVTKTGSKLEFASVPPASIILHLCQDSLLPLTGSIDMDNGIDGSIPPAYLPLLNSAEATKGSIYKHTLTFLETVGELYKAGLNINYAAIYGLKYPMREASPPISPLVVWNHDVSWHVPLIHKELQRNSGIPFDRSDLAEDFTGHKIDGRTVFPAAGYLNVVWRAYAFLKGRKQEELAVIFERVRFEELIIVPEVGRFEISAHIMLDSGQFSVSVDDMVTCKGTIHAMEDVTTSKGARLGDDAHSVEGDGADGGKTSPVKPRSANEEISAEQFYQAMHVMGFRNSGSFRSVLGVNPKRRVARVAWHGNWTTLLDSMFQVLSVFESKGKQLVRALPASVTRLAIDPVGVRRQDTAREVVVQYEDSLRLLQGPGVDVEDINFSYTATKPRQDVCLEETKFCPYVQEETVVDTSDAVRFLLQVALSNSFSRDLNVIENVERVELSIADAALAEGLIPYQRNVSLALFPSHPSAVTRPNFVSSNRGVAVKVNNMDDIVAEEFGPAVDVWILRHESDDRILPIANHRARFLLISVLKSNTFSYPVGRILLASRKSEDGGFFLLLGKPDVRQVSKAVEVGSREYGWVPALQSSLRVLDDGKLVIYADSDPHSGIIGLINCLHTELELTNRSTCFYRVEESHSEEKWNFAHPSTSLAQQLQKGCLFNVFYKGRWGMFANSRLRTQNEQTERSVAAGFGSDVALMATVGVGMGQAGWVQQPPGWVSRWQDELIDVRYSTINFKDVMLTTGKLLVTDPLHVEVLLNYEYSGVTSKGDRVLIVASPPQINSRGLSKDDPCCSPWAEKFVFRIPESWSLAEACTTPTPYLTAYYCLHFIAKVRKGQSVLIHSGAGGLGMAVIYLALRKGCTVFTTVGSEEKREFLKTHFPALKDAHISSSRNPLEFKRQFLRETQGKGVDVALNTLSQDSLLATLGTVRKSGIFIELGKYDLQRDTNLGLRLLRNGVTFVAVDLRDILVMSRQGERDELLDWFRSALETMTIEPLPFTTYSAQEYGDALRMLSSGKNIGRCLLDLKPEDTVSSALVPSVIPAQLRTYFDPHKVYILVGGFSGIGQLVLNWMHSRGAKYFVITTTRVGREALFGSRAFIVDSLTKLGAEIYVQCLDVSVAEEASKLIAFAEGIGEGIVGGIFNFAVQLRDGLFQSQSEQNYAEANGPKGTGTINLDALMRGRERCKLDYFVVLSSILSTTGGAGVSTYGFANSVMEQVIRRRRSDALPGVAVCFGAIGSVGILSNMDEDTVIGGTIPQAALSCIDTLDTILANQPFSSSPVINSYVMPTNRDVEADGDGVKGILLKLARIFGFHQLSQVNFQKSLSDLGLDSLIDAEIKAFLRSHNLEGLLTKKLGSLTFEEISQMLSRRTDSEELKQLHPPPLRSETILDDLFWFPAILPPVKIPAQPMVNWAPKMHSSKNIVFLVHPVDGSMAYLGKLANSLHAQVYGLQCCSCDHEIQSIKELAEQYLQLIRSVPSELPITLCGYSYGSIIALEIALMMQKQRLPIRYLISLDGSPKVVQNIINFIFSRLPENRSASFLLTYLHSLNISLASKDVTALQSVQNEEQFYLAAEILCRELSLGLSVDELCKSLRLMQTLVIAAASYIPDDVFRGNTILVKATQTSGILGRGLSESYGLEEHCSSLRLINFDGHHDFVNNDLEYAKLAVVINSILEGPDNHWSTGC